MHTDRSAILSMVATGQITPREAERLLAVGSDEEDLILRLALCLAFVGIVLPPFANTMIAVGHVMAFLLPVIERTLCLMGGCV